MALIELLPVNSWPVEAAPPMHAREAFDDRSVSDVSASVPVFTARQWHVPISLASEAFAEVLSCEIAIQIRDRLKDLRADVLQGHYHSHLTRILVNHVEGSSSLDDLLHLDDGAWEGLVWLLNWCAKRGCVLKPILSQAGTSGLVEDDRTGIQILACAHEYHRSRFQLPCAVLQSARLLVAAGNTRSWVSRHWICCTDL